MFLLPACVGSATTGETQPSGNAKASAPPKFKSPAPEIAGEDMAGKPVALSEMRGKVVLVDFWATWCPPCVGEIPHEKRLAEKFKNRPFEILGVSRDRELAELKRFLDSEKLPWRNIFDADGSVCLRWKVEAYPTFFLIDHRGAVAARWVGGGQSGQIEKAVEAAIRTAEAAAAPNEG